MKKQIITWTAIPKGLQGPLGPGGSLFLSVFISPRLQENGTPKLQDFPAWLKWPDTLANVKFKVRFAGGPTISAKVVSARPDIDYWEALFKPDTPVNPFQFEDRTNQFIRSYPVARLGQDLAQRYKEVIQMTAQDPGGLPDVRHSIKLVTDIVPFQARGTYIQAQLGKLIDTELQRLKAIPPHAQPGGIAGDYHQVDTFMHRKTAQPYTADPSTHPPKPKKSDLYDLFDFHKMVSALGNYPELLVTLGLVVELEFPFKPGIPTGINASTVSVITSKFNGVPNVHPHTHYSLDAANGFRAAPRGGSELSDDLLLRLGDKSTFETTQMDIGGTAVKWLGMANNIIEHAIDPPAGLSLEQGVPSLRSAGIALVHTGRAYNLALRFQTANAQNTAAETNAPVDLYADDLVRGYAIDIWDKLTNKWHSLNMRNGSFHFKRAPGGKQTLPTHGEGFVTMATSQPPGSTPNDLYLHEQIFRWNGWSLAAPRPITPIGVDGTGEKPETPADLQNPDITRYGLTIDFKVPDASLPKLRFGHFYKVRARMVSIAGHSVDAKSAGALLPAVQTNPEAYLRWESLVAPAITLRHSIKGSPGESTARMVIRSDFDRSVDQYYADQASPPYNKDAERHFLPPKTSQMMAETHGKFDGPPPAGKSWYKVIVETDVNLPSDPKPPYDPLPQNVDKLKLPYLPDPIADGATFVGLPGVPLGKPFTAPTWGGAWPYLGTFRFLLKGIDPNAVPHHPKWDATNALLTVELHKGEMITVRYSSRPITGALQLMALWDWIVAAGLGGVYQKAAEAGIAWLLTPFHELTLVHAVQRPLIKPRFSHLLRGARQPGDTSAILIDEPMKISGHSTVKLDLEAMWYEPIDDVTQPVPAVQSHQGHVSEIPLEYPDTLLIFPDAAAPQDDSRKKFFTHEFSNTKYHRVSYMAVATTRYREYFPFTPAELAAKPDLITRSSDTSPVPKPDAEHPKATSIVDAAHPLPLGMIDVPSSARPLSPQLLYIMPTYTHETTATATGIDAERRGGGLRVYLERPWFSSGEGELLGVVLPPQNFFRARRGLLAHFYKTPDVSHTTQWGLDPIWNSRNAPSPTSPAVSAFTNAVRTGNGLSIDEQGGVAVAVAGHEVAYDRDRRVWYSDIELSGGFAYYPFVRLVLARYQPNSIPSMHLSRLVLADFAQIAPNRSATVVFNSDDPYHMRITVQGPAPIRTTNRIEVSLEQQVLGANGGDPDLGWIAVDRGTITLQQGFAKLGTFWAGEYTLPPLPSPLPPLRLVIREYEIFRITPTTPVHAVRGFPTTQRLVYAEIVDVLVPS